MPDVWAAEDTIFWICTEDIEEFAQYLTRFDDIEGKLDEKYLSEAYRNLRLDSVRKRKNGELAHIEHHSVIKKDSLSRNFEYLATLHAATEKLIHPSIFNTGKIPEKTVEYASPTSSYAPVWFNTQEIEASEKLNNIKYKTSKQEALSVFEVIELIWMPKFRTDMPIEDLILEMIDVYQDIIIEERLTPVLKKSLIIWAGKYVSTQEKKEKAIRGLKMSAIEELDFSAVIRSARIEGALLRSEEKGREEGHAEGHAKAEEEFVLKLLKTDTPQEISEKLEIPLKRVIEIKNGN